jgi:hypothetical protein
MIHGTSLLSMYAGAMNTNVAMGYEMMCFMVVGWFRVSDMKKLPDYIPMYIIILLNKSFCPVFLILYKNLGTKKPQRLLSEAYF